MKQFCLIIFQLLSLYAYSGTSGQNIVPDETINFLTARMNLPEMFGAALVVESARTDDAMDVVVFALRVDFTKNGNIFPDGDQINLTRIRPIGIGKSVIFVRLTSKSILTLATQDKLFLKVDLQYSEKLAQNLVQTPSQFPKVNVGLLNHLVLAEPNFDKMRATVLLTNASEMESIKARLAGTLKVIANTSQVLLVEGSVKAILDASVDSAVSSVGQP